MHSDVKKVSDMQVHDASIKTKLRNENRVHAGMPRVCSQKKARTSSTNKTDAQHRTRGGKLPHEVCKVDNHVPEAQSGYMKQVHGAKRTEACGAKQHVSPKSICPVRMAACQERDAHMGLCEA